MKKMRPKLTLFSTGLTLAYGCFISVAATGAVDNDTMQNKLELNDKAQPSVSIRANQDAVKVDLKKLSAEKELV